KTYTDNNLAKLAVPNFNAELLKPKKVSVKPVNIKKLEEDFERQKQENARLLEENRQKAIAEKGKEEADKEVKELKAQVEALKKENQKVPDTHDYNEAETRRVYIDTYLEEAGWDLSDKDVREYPVTGMPNKSGKGQVDYVLWGGDGLPLAVVEAKRTTKDPRAGQQQAKLYADCLEKMKKQRPVIFYTNGYDTYIWDDQNYSPRRIHGFYKKEELTTLIQRRKTRMSISKARVNQDIAGRYYQIEAIQQVSEHFEGKHRKALLVMATGSGKTRTAIALVDILLKNNWTKRILFLADRNALVSQARNAFKTHLPNASPEILKGKTEATSRICLSTYPAMMNRIDQSKDGKKLFSVGHFDLIIIDEAHRSVYHRYKAIFDYFDSLLVGLTATPRREVDKNTYSLFDIENGNPTYYYELEKAVEDGVLVPPKAVSVPLKFQREGIKYSELSPEEQEEYETKLYNEDTGEIPDKVDPGALNNWLYNTDTIDKVLKHLMSEGLKVESGDRLGKTIIFAKNHKHAEFICERFDRHYPEVKGSFCRVIDNYVQNAESLIDDFRDETRNPVIAVSVDMLDTGIDVPDILNLVFFKIVRSKTKFHQMIGRGTRLCPDVFGLRRDKEYFMIFDYCQNFEFFDQYPDGIEPSVQKSLSEKLFKGRLSLAMEIHRLPDDQPQEILDLKEDLLSTLHNEVIHMNKDNFFVRSRLEYVEKYGDREKWNNIDRNDRQDLLEYIADLPSNLPMETEVAKRFDMLMLTLQMSLLEGSSRFNHQKDQVIEIAANLEGKQTIPQVQKEIKLILAIQNDDFWEDTSLAVLEDIRLRLRALIQFIDKDKQEIVYTSFIDTLGEKEDSKKTSFGNAGEFRQYRLRVERYIESLENHLVIHKLKTNKPITPRDIKDLEGLFYSAAEVESKEKFEEVYGEQEQLGVFIRKLVGLDRKAAVGVFNNFLKDKTLNSTQIHFIDQLISYLTQNGVMDPKTLYESPFTDLHYEGVEGLFKEEKVDTIIQSLQGVQENAVA
ncbi:MAG TPA: DEAD/DEAH box helicase, partial [Spirochaetes bacterium]|nr:DEAD/DEAH box helicase [Spirochaetota bacterium]